MPGRARIRRPLSIFLWITALLLLLAAVVLLSPVGQRHLRAACVIYRLAHPEADPRIQLTESQFSTRLGTVRARLYSLPHHQDAPSLLLVPGVHYLGLDEPRLNELAQAFAAVGIQVAVVAPPSLTDYRISPDSIQVIGEAAQWFHRLHHQRVGVMGISFSGGLALMAAADPRFQPDIGSVEAIGAHDDLRRTSLFLVTGNTTLPDGSTVHLDPNPYGALVLLFGRLQDFFPSPDLPAAGNAIRLLLHGDQLASQQAAGGLSPRGRKTMEEIYREDLPALRARLLHSIDHADAELQAVSPVGHLQEVHVPVLLLHGKGDSLIPASETLWLARGLPPNVLKTMLISPALSHVDLEDQPTLRDHWELIHWVAVLLQTLDQTSKP